MNILSNRIYIDIKGCLYFLEEDKLEFCMKILQRHLQVKKILNKFSNIHALEFNGKISIKEFVLLIDSLYSNTFFDNTDCIKFQYYIINEYGDYTVGGHLKFKKHSFFDGVRVEKLKKLWMNTENGFQA